MTLEKITGINDNVNQLHDKVNNLLQSVKNDIIDPTLQIITTQETHRETTQLASPQRSYNTETATLTSPRKFTFSPRQTPHRTLHVDTSTE